MDDAPRSHLMGTFEFEDGCAIRFENVEFPDLENLSRPASINTSSRIIVRAEGSEYVVYSARFREREVSELSMLLPSPNPRIAGMRLTAGYEAWRGGEVRPIAYGDDERAPSYDWVLRVDDPGNSGVAEGSLIVPSDLQFARSSLHPNARFMPHSAEKFFMAIKAGTPEALENARRAAEAARPEARARKLRVLRSLGGSIITAVGSPFPLGDDGFHADKGLIDLCRIPGL